MVRLHHLYEQAVGTKERFVYSCSSCGRAFEIRRGSGSSTLPAGLCRGCGRPLKDNSECRLACIPEELPDGPDARVQGAGQLFRPASSIPHFSLGFARLDSLLRPMSAKHLVVFSGSPSSAVGELAAFRAQLPIDSGGLDSGVVFIDGGNRSDPYLFSSFAKQKGLRPLPAMKRVASCRAFTFYQLASLVSEHLVRAAEDYGAGLVVIADILGMFNEPELEESEARRVLDAIRDGIEETKRRTLVIATLASPNKYDDTVTSWADTAIRMSSDGDTIRAERLERRNRPSATATFKRSQLMKATKREVPH